MNRPLKNIFWLFWLFHLPVLAQTPDQSFIHQIGLSIDHPSKPLIEWANGSYFISGVIENNLLGNTSGWVEITGDQTRWVSLPPVKTSHLKIGSGRFPEIMVSGVFQLNGNAEAIYFGPYSEASIISLKYCAIGSQLEVADQIKLADQTIISGQFTSQTQGHLGFIMVTNPNLPNQLQWHTFQGLNPMKMIPKNESSIYVVGEVFNPQNNSWNSLGFIGEFNLAGNWDQMVELNPQGLISVHEIVLDQSKGTVFIGGELQNSQTKKQDIFIGKLNPTNWQMEDLLIFGNEDFEFCQELISISDSNLMVLGSSEYYGNGIDNPFSSKIDKSLNHTKSEIMPQSFRGRIHSAGIENGLVNFAGTKYTIEGPNASFYGTVDPQAQEIWCNGSIADFHEYRYSISHSPKAVPVQKISLSASDTTFPFLSTTIQKIEICEMPICPSEIIIQGSNEICLGETLNLETRPELEVDWFWNGTYAGTGSSISINPEHSGGQQVELTFQQGNCNLQSQKNIVVHASPDFSISGPRWICPGDSLSVYSISGDPLENQEFEIRGGILKQITAHELSIQWLEDHSEFSISSRNSFGCRTTRRHPIRMDSILSPSPSLNYISWEGDSILCHLEVSNWSELNQKEIWVQNHSGTWELWREFDERILYTFPGNKESKTGERVRLMGLDHCRIPFVGREHQTIYAKSKGEFQSNDIEWTEYEGWDHQPIYSLAQTEPNYELLFETGTLNQTSIPELTDARNCFRIMASNPDFVSYSNELCISAEKQFLVNNVITPNGDGHNDQLKVQSIYPVENFYWELFNRSGVRVMEFSGDPELQDFSLLNAGIYFFQVVEGKEKNWKGWFQVIR